MRKPLTLLAAALLTLQTAASSTAAAEAEAAADTVWREEPAVAALFRKAGVEGTFVVLEQPSGSLRGHNRRRAEQRFVPASS